MFDQADGVIGYERRKMRFDHLLILRMDREPEDITDRRFLIECEIIEECFICKQDPPVHAEPADQLRLILDYRPVPFFAFPKSLLGPYRSLISAITPRTPIVPALLSLNVAFLIIISRIEES